MTEASLPTLAEIEAKVRALAVIVGADGYVIPTFGRSDDGARPHIEVNDAGMHYVVVERGQKLSRQTTRDLDTLLWYVFDSITSSLSINYELHHRERGRDNRRRMFVHQVQLLNKLSAEWAMRAIADQRKILTKYPFDDASEDRVNYAVQLRNRGHSDEQGWLMACEKYPLPKGE